MHMMTMMLLPLALVLAAAGRDPALVTVAQTTTVRFSTFGIASVGTLLVTGSINTWYLVGSATALTDTYYGRLLLTKVALFFGMVAIAAVNRLHFTPRLVQVGSGFAAQDALRRLRRNTSIEVVRASGVQGTRVPCLNACGNTHRDRDRQKKGRRATDVAPSHRVSFLARRDFVLPVDCRPKAWLDNIAGRSGWINFTSCRVQSLRHVPWPRRRYP